MAMNEPPISADGLNKLYDAGEDAKVDIVFVHGLMGHPRNTWEAVNPSDPNEMIYWPKELLPITVPESRGFAFGYPTGFATFYPIVTDPIAHTTIDNNATSLIVKLGTIRRETHTESRPIFFIAHSLGGLVCANGLSSRSDAQSQRVVNHTRGVIFLGTPFQGSSKVTWAKMAEKFLGLFGDSNNQTIKDLDQDSSKLKQISFDFHMLLRERYESRDPKPIQVACFFETKSTTKKWGPLKKDLGQIVTAESATLAGYKAIPINADHRTMCKFPDDETTGYIDVTGMLKVMISNLDKDVDELKRDGRMIIKLGGVKQGDNVLNYGIIAGHVVGTTEDANKLEVSNTFNSFGENSSAGDAAVAAWMAKKLDKDAEAKSSRT